MSKLGSTKLFRKKASKNTVKNSYTKSYNIKNKKMRNHVKNRERKTTSTQVNIQSIYRCYS